MNIIKQKMYDRTAESFVIGSLLNNPLLLSDDRYHLLESDFSDVGQQAIFYAIKRLAETGSTEITPQAVDLYLKQYEIRYTAYQNIRGLSFVTGCCDIVKKSDVKQFDLYYERLKKFSVLRALNAAGINTDNFYNPNKDILNSDIEDIKLNNTSIDEMLNSIRSNLVKIENNALGKSQAVAKTAGDGLQELLADLRAHPEIGLPLDGQLVNWSVRGARLGKLYIYSAPSGAGKALPNSTLIPMFDGSWKKVGDVRVGDKLIDRHGKATKVLQIYPQGLKKVYKITFKDGREALCNDEHLWSYADSDECSALKTKTLRELIKIIKTRGYQNNGHWNINIPFNKPIDYAEQSLAIEPYSLGILLGKKLKYNIPSNYLIGSISQRTALLQGILDSNSSINKIITVHKTIAYQIQQLCWSLGLICNIDTQDNNYVLHINGSVEAEEKLFGLKTRVKNQYKNLYNPIVNITPLDQEEEMTCFYVDNEEHLFLMNDYIVTHNTRHMVGNACAISMPYIDEQGQVVERADYRKILFVATEMQIDEIQTLILAHVSGVNEEHILYSRFTPEEETRIVQASKIIDMYKDNFLIECIPDPSIAMIKTRLIKYIVQDQIQYIFYDYIFSSPGLLTEFRDVAVREDVALMMLSNTLKEIAMQYNVFIQSATQLNENWSKREIGLRDQNCLRGSKAIADKVDIGMIGVRLNPEEYKQIDAIWVEIARKNHYDVNKKPNIVIDIYKNRRGKITCKKIFRYFDFGTCRCQDLFMTDDTYKVEQEIGEINFEVRKRGVLDFLAEEAGNNAN